MIYDHIQSDVKEAMKARDQARVAALRYLVSEIKKVAIDQRVEIDDSVVLPVLARLTKQRREGIEEFRKAGRADLVEKEENELAILDSYRPQALSEEEVKAEVAAVIRELGATSRRDLGKVMKAALARLAGRAEGKAVQAAAASLLP